MVNLSPALDDVFAALANPTRRAILHQLRRGPLATTELRTPASMSLPALMKHLRALEQAGLLQGRKEGRTRRYHLTLAPLQDAAGWLDDYRAFWEGRLDALERYLREDGTDD